MLYILFENIEFMPGEVILFSNLLICLKYKKQGMDISVKDNTKDNFLEGVVNTAISVPIVYGIYLLSSEPIDITFVLVAVALTAFFTGYYTRKTGGLDYFSK